MCIKLLSRDLNLAFCPHHPQEFCICRMTITPKVRNGQSVNNISYL